VHSWFGKLGDVATSHSMGEPYNPMRPGPTERELLLDAVGLEPAEAAPAQALAVYSFASVVPHPSKVREADTQALGFRGRDGDEKHAAIVSFTQNHCHRRFPRHLVRGEVQVVVVADSP
jgi:hypothetical protein